MFLMVNDENSILIKIQGKILITMAVLILCLQWFICKLIISWTGHACMYDELNWYQMHITYFTKKTGNTNKQAPININKHLPKDIQRTTNHNPCMKTPFCTSYKIYSINLIFKAYSRAYWIHCKYLLIYHSMRYIMSNL